MKLHTALLAYYHKMNRNPFTVIFDVDFIPYDFRIHGRYVVSYQTLLEIDEFSGVVIYRQPDTVASGIYGGWYNKDDGIFYIEKNQTFTEKEEALKFGRQYKQKFIWDGKEQKEIEV